MKDIVFDKKRIICSNCDTEIRDFEKTISRKINNKTINICEVCWCNSIIDWVSVMKRVNKNENKS